MMYVLLLLSIVLGVCKSGIYNRFAKAEKPDAGGIFTFNAVSYGTAAIVTFLLGVGKDISYVTFACAAVYAVFVFSLQALSVAAMRTGPMSLTSLFVLYGMIIPSLAGPIFWREKFGVFQAVGIAVMLISVWLLRDRGETATAAGRKWVIMVVLCFLFSGLAGVVEKVHQTSGSKGERIMFLFTACSMMFILSLIGRAAVHGRSGRRVRGSDLLLGASSGAIVSFYSQINLTLAGSLDSLIYYPVANGGALLLTVLVSAVVFREKLTGRRLVGFVAGLASIILLSVPV